MTVDEADLDVLPQEPIDEDDIIGLRWEDIARASSGIVRRSTVFVVKTQSLHFNKIIKKIPIQYICLSICLVLYSLAAAKL